MSPWHPDQRLGELAPRLDHARRIAWRLGGGLLAASVLVGLFQAQALFQGYLLAYLFILGFALGSLGLTLLHNVTGGNWGMAIRRVLEGGMATLPACALLFLPIAVAVYFFEGAGVFPWADPETVARDGLLQHKAPYLNAEFFLARAAVYFGAWLLLALRLRALADERERAGETDPMGPLSKRLRSLSAPGLGLYGLTMSFAAFDWAMSLEPHWFSTLYGLIFVVGQVLSAMALAVAFTGWLAATPNYRAQLTVDRFHDLGKLLFAFVMLWAYVAYSQYLIIWSGNLAEETPWYLARSHMGWKAVAIFLFSFHFFLPFGALLSRSAKRNVTFLTCVAAALVGLRAVDFYWLIVPAYPHQSAVSHALHILMLLGMASLWAALFLQKLRGRPLVVSEELRVPEGKQGEVPAH